MGHHFVSSFLPRDLVQLCDSPTRLKGNANDRYAGDNINHITLVRTIVSSSRANLDPKTEMSSRVS